uniref:Methyltransferase-like protein 23 n=1 Tax=Elaeophora elaphi TaxID=1147741 RepID=A0A0R3RVZ6_9BILA
MAEYWRHVWQSSEVLAMKNSNSLGRLVTIRMRMSLYWLSSHKKLCPHEIISLILVRLAVGGCTCCLGFYYKKEDNEYFVSYDGKVSYGNSKDQAYFHEMLYFTTLTNSEESELVDCRCSQIYAYKINDAGDYISANRYLFEGQIILELGAGCTGIPGIVAAKCGAKLVIFTDHPESEEAFKILKQNCIENSLDESSFLIKDLDWNAPNLNQVLDDVPVLHYILAADVFYDITVFGAFIRTVASLLQLYPKATCIFAYEERNSDTLQKTVHLKRRATLSAITMNRVH